MQQQRVGNQIQRSATANKVLAAMALLPMLALAGCRLDMHNEPKFFPQRGSTLFPDGRSVRPQVEYTIARGQLDEDSYFYTGLQNGKEGNVMPFPVTMEVLARGQERYNIYCTPCHSRVGNGRGMIVDRGYAHAGDYHTARLEKAPLGHFFNVMTNGYGAMPDYAAQVTPQDRWAIVAYIKALQLSQNAQQSDIPAGKHVEPLRSIAEREGFPPGFATDWGLPPTAVTGTPNGEDLALPTDSIGAAGPRAGELPRIHQPAGPNPQREPQSSTGYPWVRPSPNEGGSQE